MKSKNIFAIMALSLGLSLGFSSCVSDDSTDGTQELPQLSIKGSDATTLPIHNVYLSKECHIKPEITYNGNVNDLKYNWQVGTYANRVKGALKEVSTEPELKYVFPAGGSYYVHLAVTDGKVGQVVEYQVNVNRIFEEGYLLTSTDADGKGNLNFIKVMTPEEKAEGNTEMIVEHCLSSQNEGVSEDGLVKAVQCTISYPRDLTRILVSTKDHCYFLDPNDFTVIQSISYDDLYPGFQASNFMQDVYAPYAYDKNMKKFAHLNLNYMFPYEYNYFKDFKMDDCILSYCLNYQEKAAPLILYVNYADSKVSLFSWNASSFGKNTYFPDTENLLEGEKLLTAFAGSSMSTVYVLSQGADDSHVTLWKNANAGYVINAQDFTHETVEVTSNTAIPAKGCRFVYSPIYNRYFYPVDNCVYVYLPQNAFVLPTKDQYAIKFAESEEITYMETNFDTEELYVATYDKLTQRGNFYIYDCKDVTTNNMGNIQPKEAYKSCAGRISYLMYKPSIQ